MLTFAEELILLSTDERGLLPAVQKDALDCAAAGAALMELAFARRIDTDPQALAVIDTAPTGDPALDRVLAKLAAGAEAADTRKWIRELSVDEAPAIRERALAGLVARGVLARRDGRSPRVFRLPRHRVVDSDSRDAVIRRLGEALHSDDIPDPRDAALISLLSACDILPDLFPRGDIERCGPRLERLRKLDLIGREAVRAIADIQGTAILAARSHSARLRGLSLRLSVVVGLAAVATLAAPRIPIPDRFGPTFPEILWSDEAWQRWSGYVLLGFSGAAAFAVLLARMRPVARRGGANRLRFAHAMLSLACALALFAHTGFRLGANLNAALMGCYLAVLIFGALTGIAMNGAAQLRKLGVAPRLRAAPTKLHTAALYPLPALVVVHLLIVYLY